jgi:hypothetical protein
MADEPFESSQNRLGFESGAERIVEKCLNVPQEFPAVTIERKSERELNAILVAVVERDAFGQNTVALF